jgi:hypothetical protein
VPIEPWYTAYIVESTSSYADIGVVPYEAYAIVEVHVYAYGKGSNMRFRWASELGAYHPPPYCTCDCPQSPFDMFRPSDLCRVDYVTIDNKFPLHRTACRSLSLSLNSFVRST